MDPETGSLAPQTERPLTPQECADLIIAGVTYDPDLEKGTWPYHDELRTRVAALCAATGLTEVDDTTTVWKLVQRVLEINGTALPENLVPLEAVLNTQMTGDVVTVMSQAGLGSEGPLDMFITNVVVPGMTQEQGATYLHDEINS